MIAFLLSYGLNCLECAHAQTTCQTITPPSHNCSTTGAVLSLDLILTSSSGVLICFLLIHRLLREQDFPQKQMIATEVNEVPNRQERSKNDCMRHR